MSDMDRSALEYLDSQSVSAAELQDLGLDLNDHKQHFWDAKGQKPEEFQVWPPPRKHTVTTLPSFAAAVGAYALLEGAAVWVSLEKIVAVLNDGTDFHRDNLISMPVAVSPLFGTLAGMKGHNKQQALLNLIRHDLRPSKIAPSSFELAISNLRWEENSTTEGSFGTLKSTVGKQIRGEVKAESDIPPEVEISFEPFPALSNALNANVTVECSVVIDPLNQTITVTPFPGQLDMAKASAVEQLRAKVAELVGDVDSKRTFAGSP